MPVILLLLLPVVEIYLFFKIGAEIGPLAVIVWLVGAAFFGVNILRYLGATAMLSAARQLQAGAAPGQTLADALVKAIAAVLLVIPGFATDFMAILLFIPPLRRYLLKRWVRKFTGKSSRAAAGFSANDRHFGGNIYEHEEDINGKAEVIKGNVLDGKLVEDSSDKTPR
ncbi:MAG: FxsA family protein [Pseudomonadota bacterium]